MSTPWTRAPHPNPTVDSLRPTSGLPLPGRAPRLDCLPVARSRDWFPSRPFPGARHVSLVNVSAAPPRDDRREAMAAHASAKPELSTGSPNVSKSRARHTAARFRR